MHVLAVGAAAPAHRLPAAEVAAAWGRRGGRGQAAVCAADEDVLTLAAEAADRAITASGLQTDIVDGLWWGTSRPPFAEGPSHAVLAAAIGLSTKSGGALCSGSPHAGMEALLGAADAIGAGSARVALVVVSDAVVPGAGTVVRGAMRRRCGRHRARRRRRRPGIAGCARHADSPVPRPVPGRQRAGHP